MVISHDKDKQKTGTQYRELLYGNYFSSQGFTASSLEETLNHRKYYNNYFLKRFLPEDKNIKILDLGCGYGAILISLQDLGYSNFTGVDSWESIQLLKATQLENRVVEADIITFLEKSVEEGEKWDVILAIDVLEHFTKDELVYILPLLRQLVSISGRLIIKIPNAQSPTLAGTVTFGDFTHETHFTPGSLTQVLKSCNFMNVKAYEAHPVPHTIVSSIRYYLWNVIRLLHTFLYAVETGVVDNSMVWSYSFFAVARND